MGAKVRSTLKLWICWELGQDERQLMPGQGASYTQHSKQTLVHNNAKGQATQGISSTAGPSISPLAYIAPPPPQLPLGPQPLLTWKGWILPASLAPLLGPQELWRPRPSRTASIPFHILSPAQVSLTLPSPPQKGVTSCCLEAAISSPIFPQLLHNPCPKPFPAASHLTNFLGS